MFDDSLSNSSQRNDQTPLDCLSGCQVNENTNIIPGGAEHQVDKGGITFSEIGIISTASQVNCCNLSSDGKLLVIGGYDKKANVWSTDLGEQRCVLLEEHSDEITDACFSRRRPWLATSSFDQTIKVWDVEETEGAANEDGKGPSIWDTFTQKIPSTFSICRTYAIVST